MSDTQGHAGSGADKVNLHNLRLQIREFDEGKFRSGGVRYNIRDVLDEAIRLESEVSRLREEVEMATHAAEAEAECADEAMRENTRLRAELGEANKRARIAEEDADRLAANGFHEEVCGQGEGVYHGCYDGCGWGKALWEHQQAAATRPASHAERAKGEGGAG